MKLKTVIFHADSFHFLSRSCCLPVSLRTPENMMDRPSGCTCVCVRVSKCHGAQAWGQEAPLGYRATCVVW